MKKLGKLNLKEMKSEMSLLPEGAQVKLLGGYTNDCFWRCVAYMESGGNNYGPSDAATYANSYFNDGRQDFAVDHGDIGSFYSSMGSSYNPDFSDGQEIVMFNTADSVGGYENTGTWHAVVITGTSGSGGGYTYFDPQTGLSGVFTGSDMEKTTYAGY
ncbi:hypothetical protein [Gaoshiqia sp. Z1-71]|uniref:hypothetical protein n=1 Tax=Gaoshiqia hydrogeniformans TaxID=3290090 RepID=UPI003BF8AC8F